MTLLLLFLLAHAAVAQQRSVLLQACCCYCYCLSTPAALPAPAAAVWLPVGVLPAAFCPAARLVAAAFGVPDPGRLRGRPGGLSTSSKNTSTSDFCRSAQKQISKNSSNPSGCVCDSTLWMVFLGAPLQTMLYFSQQSANTAMRHPLVHHNKKSPIAATLASWLRMLRKIAQTHRKYHAGAMCVETKSAHISPGQHPICWCQRTDMSLSHSY